MALTRTWVEDAGPQNPLPHLWSQEKTRLNPPPSCCHFDGVDTGEGYTKLHNFGVYTGTPFCDFSREFRVLVSAVREKVTRVRELRGASAFWPLEKTWCWRWFRWRWTSSFPPWCLHHLLGVYIVPWFYGHGPEAVRFVGCDVEGFQSFSA